MGNPFNQQCTSYCLYGFTYGIANRQGGHRQCAVAATVSENTTRQNRTEVKPDRRTARKIRWGEGAGVALCGCGRPLSGDGGGAGETGTHSLTLSLHSTHPLSCRFLAGLSESFPTRCGRSCNMQILLQNGLKIVKISRGCAPRTR
jgi:hypothetical protein